MPSVPPQILPEEASYQQQQQPPPPKRKRSAILWKRLDPSSDAAAATTPATGRYRIVNAVLEEGQEQQGEQPVAEEQQGFFAWLDKALEKI